jgi:glycosyltransferase involved in cell wall biosynthesis
MLDLSVIICTYSEGRWALLSAAIQSILDQTTRPREIIVVVDHNHDLFERVRTDLVDVIAVENSGVPGLSSARNSGIAAAQGSVVAFLDDDAVASPEWAATLAQPYADPLVAGVGGSIEPLWIRGRPAWFPPEFDWVVGCTYRGMPTATAPVRNVIGCNMSFRGAVVVEAGPFHPVVGRLADHPAGCEETHFCIALARRFPHLQVLYEPAARVWHQVPADRSQWRYFRSRCYAEGRSKALVSSLLGTDVSLSSERSYTIHTLPRGFLAGLTDAATRRDAGGLARSATIASGLAITTAGFAHEWLASAPRRGAGASARTVKTVDRAS